MKAATRQQEILEMAAKLTEKADPTDQEIAEMQDVAAQVVDGIEWALKMVRGEVPRPSRDFWGWLEDLKREVEDEVCVSDGD